MNAIKSVAFNLDGDWLTNFLRQRYLYEDADFEWVTETINKLLEPNGLEYQRIIQIAQDIILGRSRFSGNTRDGSFAYCDCSDEHISPDFFMKFSALRKDLKHEQEARQEIVKAWNELALVAKGEIDRNDCESQCNIELFRPTPTEEFIDRMIPDEACVPPYGFISPDGKFREVAYADHENYAQEYLRKIREKKRAGELGYLLAKDYLVFRRGWLLLHNPSLGKPILTHGDLPMTKAQRETLFDYYTKYGMKQEANALYEEDNT